MKTIFTPLTSARSRHGFTMLEMLGVLVVIVILALALLPSLMKQADITARDLEQTSLRNLADGLQTSIVKTRIIPGTGTIAQDIAAQLGWLVSDVSTNARGMPRYFLVDPALRIGTSNGTLPYVQGTSGSIKPVNPRIMILSSMGQDLPASVTSGSATNASVFESLWNSADGVAPTTNLASACNWDDVIIQRQNLGLLFVQVILNNNPASLTPTNRLGRYSVGDTNQHVYLPSVPFSAYFLKGTALGLHDSYGALQVLQVLQECPELANGNPYFIAPSFVYETPYSGVATNGVWRGKLFLLPNTGLTRCGADLQAAYEVFMSGVPNRYHVGAANQQTVTMSMYLYMSNYCNWAYASPPFSGSSAAHTAMHDAHDYLATLVGAYSDKQAATDP